MGGCLTVVMPKSKPNTSRDFFLNHVLLRARKELLLGQILSQPLLDGKPGYEI